jgi:N-acetylglucosamine kinase-like BadF-type ATPase
MFQSLPLTIREVKATEARLNAIYDAAKLGLRGDSLALASGLLPAEYRQLCVLDPIAEMAEQKGRADGERQLSEVVHKAALEGDAKAALEILKHQHGWVAKQAISVEVDQRISITGALAKANERVLEFINAETLPSRPAPSRISNV